MPETEAQRTRREAGERKEARKHIKENLVIFMDAFLEYKRRLDRMFRNLRNRNEIVHTDKISELLREVRAFKSTVKSSHTINASLATEFIEEAYQLLLSRIDDLIELITYIEKPTKPIKKRTETNQRRKRIRNHSTRRSKRTRKSVKKY